MRRGRQQKPPLAELGDNPDNGQPVRVLEGRYGVYVTDGEINATVPRGSDPAALTLDEAVGLLRARAEAGGGKKKAAKKKAAKKKAGKKTTKKATKKPAAKVAKKAANKPAAKVAKQSATASDDAAAGSESSQE
jgi:DNA topoisomerase-1